ncbi:apolipoprotein N-acyltransferase [Rhodohalobacter barkolensis]|uniref:Apolipoprotein N-acyltransferase n=1 Tax=Rhodohalobacter barkolensis TaxID=2053187 RepID=A0A2N0VLP1_9BACT|nr:apolipoprotein N-acyltransferase [Rhodohalobacter barkolensis]PKD45074.1 apolipoprotein N-acyltransferase [Rhodohalobacter barkolensis]
MNKNRFWDQPWVLSITASILLSLSFPPFDLSILQIPAFVFLFRVAIISRSVREVIYYTYPAFVLWNLFVTYWLMMATVAGGVAAILANAALMLIPLLLIRKLFKSDLNPIVTSFFAAAIWVSYEFLHHNWDLAWPWLTLGNGWSNLINVIQYISVTGAFGISFWVVFTSALLYNYIVEPVKPILYSAIIIFFAFPLFSIFSMIMQTQEQGEPLEVAIIQPNSDSYQNFGGMGSLDNLIEKLLRLSGETVTESTDLLIWPENAVDAALPLDNRYFDVISDSLESWNTTLITGSGYVEYYSEENRPEVVKETSSGRIYNIFNAALHFNSSAEAEIYRKGKLVPIVERFPFVEFFQTIDLFNWIDWGSLMGYGLGEEANNFNVNGAQTPALICYDSVFSGWVNQFVQNGAGFLTIITNDGWWGDSNGHNQHFAFARLRAIEHRKWIARSANNGISGIISPDGKIQFETEYWTEDAFTFTIYNRQIPTFYSAYGDWFSYVMLLSSFLGIGFLEIRKRKQK